MPDVLLQAGAASGSVIMTAHRFIARGIRRIRARLRALIDQIDLSNFPGSCCG
jgi:hypothetical protein